MSSSSDSCHDSGFFSRWLLLAPSAAACRRERVDAVCGAGVVVDGRGSRKAVAVEAAKRAVASRGRSSRRRARGPTSMMPRSVSMDCGVGGGVVIWGVGQPGGSKNAWMD